MLEPELAWERLLSSLTPLAPHRVERRLAAGRVLAEGLIATSDLPPCTKAPRSVRLMYS